MPSLNDLFYGRDEMMIFEEDEENIMSTDINENIMCSFHKISTQSEKSHKRKLFCDGEDDSFTSQFFECERYVNLLNFKSINLFLSPGIYCPPKIFNKHFNVIRVLFLK